MTTTKWKTEHGDRTAVDRQILRTTVGSEVHGIAWGDREDHDEMGVYIEAPEVVLGVREGDGHYTARTQPEGKRSGKGDVDLSLYSLRRFLALAMTGHPTVLLPLFAPASDVLHITPAGERLRELGPSLLSRQAGYRYLGYMQGQIARVQGQDKRHVPNRPELIAAHGYDTKYASHALRLALQGLEVVEQGRLTLPMPPKERELVLSVKRGERTKEDTLAMIRIYAGRLEDRMRSGMSPLPEKPDVEMINRWSTGTHLREWLFSDE